MQLAESLYQRGILSYPRTETDKFPDGFDLKNIIQQQTANQQWGQYAAEYLLL